MLGNSTQLKLEFIGLGKKDRTDSPIKIIFVINFAVNLKNLMAQVNEITLDHVSVTHTI